MPDFDLDSALQAEPEWEPWDVFQRINTPLEGVQGERFAWVSRSARYWIKSDESVLATTGAASILNLSGNGALDMAYMVVPDIEPNQMLRAEVADGYNWYAQNLDEMSLAEQWMMTWAYFRSLPGRTTVVRVSEEEFRANFPAHA